VAVEGAKLNKLLGYEPALRVVESGRAAFFGSETADLPVALTELVAEDDRRPQFGYVGRNFERARVLVLGINPGNGPRDKRNRGDQIALPALAPFLDERTEATFCIARDAYQQVCVGWPIWRRHCNEVIGAGRLSLEEVAYSNCLPWRTASNASFADTVAERAAQLYVQPLLEDLRPQVIVALGKRAAHILALGGLLSNDVIVWNRAQAATRAVLRERAEAAARLFERLGRQGK
jgi:hypothetical protein